jgi:Tfp pilus assembly protein PilP
MCFQTVASAPPRQGYDMKVSILSVLALVLALVSLPSGASAQRGGQSGQQEQQAERALPTAAEVTLVYEREVYTYQPTGRRDPFRPLTDDDEMGPRFERLTLQGVIYSTGRGESLGLLGDGTGRVYRVRQGDVLGNARVVEIGPSRVVMAVEVFGTIRQEILELQRRGGDRR